MVQVADVMAALEEIAPPVLAEPWDNVGLMFGGRSWPVEHLLLAVDPTPAVAAQAADLQDAMIITHHPLFFDPIRRLVEGDLAHDVVMRLAEAETALYAAHTNLDKSPTHSTARALAEALGFKQVGPLAPFRPWEGKCAPAGETAQPGFGCLAILPDSMTRRQLWELVARRLGSHGARVAGSADGAATRIALVPGAGGEALALAREAGAHVMVTGELKHHEALEALHLGPTVIAAGHWETERPVLDLLQRALQERLPGVTIRIAEECPIWSAPVSARGGL
jgi:dinuclear metal center YbgI/SA1388 family protein